MNIVDGIDALADFNQRLGRHMASHTALEPIHDVICDILRSGLDFASVTKNNPLSIATEAIKHQCTATDADATIFARSGPATVGSRIRTPTATGPRRANASTTTTRNTQRAARRGTAAQPVQYTRYCFNFQRGLCSLPNCRYAHQCNACGAANHGAESCPNSR